MRTCKFFIMLTAALLLLAVLHPITSNAEPRKGVKPIYIHRTLITKSKFLFWKKTKTVDFLLVIYDKRQRGRIDSYKWWENGKLLHEGQCFSNMQDQDKFEDLMLNKAKNWTALAFDEKEDEYIISIYSKENNSHIGSFTIKPDFSDAMEFEFWRPDFRGEIINYVDPPKIPTSDRIDYFFKFKNDKRKKGEKPLQTHHLMVYDIDLDGICDNYSYLIDNFPRAVGEFRSGIDIWSAVWKFQNIVLQNEMNVIEKNPSKRRIPVVSKLDGKSIGYLEIDLTARQGMEYPMIYIEYPNVDNRYATIAEKFGLFYANFPYKDYKNFLHYDQNFWNANLYMYCDNLFVQRYKNIYGSGQILPFN